MKELQKEAHLFGNIPGVQVVHIVSLTCASEMDPGSQTTFLHWENLTSKKYHQTCETKHRSRVPKRKQCDMFYEVDEHWQLS